MLTIIHSKILLFSLTFMVTLFLVASCASNPAHKEKSAISKISSGDYEKTQIGAHSIYWDREDTIAKLMKILKRESEKDFPNEDRKLMSILYSIEALGNLRAVEAVPLLMNCFEFMTLAPGGSSRYENPTYFPAIEALIKIGKQSSSTALKELEKDVPDEETKKDAFDSRRKFCCYIIRKVEGDYAKMIIETRIKAIKDKKAAKNLKNSLKLLYYIKDRMQLGF